MRGLRLALSWAVAAAIVVVLTMAVFGDRGLPSATEVLREASQRPERDAACEELRGKLPSSGRIDADEAQRRINAAKAGTPANLRFAELDDVDLKNKDLSSADLQFARLRNAQLAGAILTGANLTCADLTLAKGDQATTFRSAVLDRALLIEAKFPKSSFASADLAGARLFRADLKEADLGAATLTGAALVSADLDKAELTHADVRLVDYRAANAPRAVALRSPDWLYPREGDFAGLVQLRKAVLDLGDSATARTITYVIEIWRNHYRVAQPASQGRWDRTASRIAAALRFVAFDWTVAYGARPWRALSLWLWLIVVFAGLYAALIPTRVNQGKIGLFRVAPKGRIEFSSGAPGMPGEAASAAMERVGTASAEVIRSALWFSVLSATRLGYGSFTLASWLGVLHPGETDYRALGPIRILAGIQALISLYLIILVAVTILGDPLWSWP
jgi:uncharacterized protein YjbI with pentapeptide repeats